jgi:hypothetical protein
MKFGANPDEPDVFVLERAEWWESLRDTPRLWPVLALGVGLIGGLSQWLAGPAEAPRAMLITLTATVLSGILLMLSNTRLTVHRVERRLYQRSTVLGVAINRRSIEYAKPKALRLDAVQTALVPLGGRIICRLSIETCAKTQSVGSFVEERELRELAAALAEFLDVPLIGTGGAQGLKSRFGDSYPEVSGST